LVKQQTAALKQQGSSSPETASSSSYLAASPPKQPLALASLSQQVSNHQAVSIMMMDGWADASLPPHTNQAM
jgi:hypothetical protein